MNKKPILFSAPMVKAIIDGRKTQTRRIIKPQPVYEGRECYGDSWAWTKGKDNFSGVTTEQLTGRTGLLHESRSCYGVPSSRLWVKETWAFENRAIFYRADSTSISGDWKGLHPDILKAFEKQKPGTIAKYAVPAPFEKPPHKWKPSIFMSRWASRLTLEITAVRVERLQDISLKDALAEGVDYDVSKDGGWPIAQYRKLWESINGKGSWNANPWVWVIEFKRIEQKA